MRDDIINNLAKYSAGQVNVCGVNHFSATNTKVGKMYAKTDGPKMTKEMKRQAHSITREDRTVVVRAGGGIVQTIGPGSSLNHNSKQGTFGGARRIVGSGADKPKRPPRHQTNLTSQGTPTVSAGGSRGERLKEREEAKSEREQIFQSNAAAVLAAQRTVPTHLEVAQAKALQHNRQIYAMDSRPKEDAILVTQAQLQELALMK